MKKNLFYAAMALALSAGAFTACSNNEIVDEQNNQQSSGTTYMSLEFSMPQVSGRAATDGQDEEDPKYNHVGKWAGKDKIAGVKVYVFDANGQLEAAPYFVESELTFANNDENMIKPKKGIRVTPGQKSVYVVVNPTDAAMDLLNGEATLTNFETKYNSADLAFASAPGTATSATASNFVSSASMVAKEVADGSSGKKEQILMTGKPDKTIDVVAGVTQEQSLNNRQNRATVTIKRAVARVMVSVLQKQFEIRGDDPETKYVTEDNYVIATVSDIKYVVAQGERKMFFSQQASDEPTIWAYKTPASEFVPTAGNFNEESGSDATAAAGHYDYSTLWRNYASTGIPGMEAPLTSSYGSDPEQANNISAALQAGFQGEVILPNTHKYGADATTTKYRKGNSAYVLVRAKLAPAKVYDENGSLYSLQPTDDVVMGQNGMFYNTREAATTGKKGVKGQTTQVFKGQKVLYYAWVNPDFAGKGWMNSPVTRNNIYHIEIKGFSRVGANWNPLVPGKPDRPENPDPKPENPSVVDPNNPGEPNIPPVNPEDPLTPTETWMSVEAKILPWKIHSYSVILGD